MAEGPLRSGFTLVEKKERRHDGTCQTVCSERREVRDNYRELTCVLRESAPPNRILHVILRAYDEGVTLCYEFPRQEPLPQVHILREETEFRFPAESALFFM